MDPVATRSAPLRWANERTGAGGRKCNAEADEQDKSTLSDLHRNRHHKPTMSYSRMAVGPIIYIQILVIRSCCGLLIT